jgi:hypothetical protein
VEKQLGLAALTSVLLVAGILLCPAFSFLTVLKSVVRLQCHERIRSFNGQELSNQTESRSLGQLLRRMKSPLSNGEAGDESQCSDRDGLFVGAYIVNQREPPSGQIFCWTVIGSAAGPEHARSHGTLLGCRWNSKKSRQGISLIGPKKEK